MPTGRQPEPLIGKFSTRSDWDSTAVIFSLAAGLRAHALFR